ncbi:glycosyltransferase family 2 protein [Flavobacterium flavipallidum]|uniref:Glycosyltransferase n=1 Tax=Flavobacterium flavipallidum TaxID=3139140 RepID=A0ABU9HJ74_9FLAO
MKFSLIICTYMRPEPLLRLLQSVQEQSLYPDEIVIIDGSLNQETEALLKRNPFQNLSYFLVSEENRGLTKQRNFGISKVADASEIVCFLDDDTVLEPDYFEQLIKTYTVYPKALGVGGYIDNEIQWEFVGDSYQAKTQDFYFDGWRRKESSRFVLRKKIGLGSDCAPGVSPLFSHGRSVGFLPPSNKIYEVEMFMGGVSSFRKNIFDDNQFSTYFEGYGLYEDADFCLRLAKKGKLYLNTAAQLNHYHEPSGRPNHYRYGKMVVRNGWYVWRVKNSNPLVEDMFKWHAITLLLMVIRFSNSFTTKNKKAAFTESLGRFVGWISLIINIPK